MSTTVGARLKYLSGLSGATIGAMLLAIGTGATVGAILVNYSGLPTGTVAQHLLVDVVVPPVGGVWNYPIYARRRNRR